MLEGECVIPLIVVKDYEEMSCRTDQAVAQQILLKKDSVLALPAGDTPFGMDQVLVQLSQEVSWLLSRGYF